MPILTLAAKDLRLLIRDPRSTVILLLTPLLLILVLGLALGEGFGEKTDDKMRISVVNLDRGLADGVKPRNPAFPGRPWSDVVLDDFTATPGIKVELLPDLETAERLVAKGRRPAVVVFGPQFSQRMDRSSFLSRPDSINPFGRDGIRFDRLDVTLLRDRTQPVSASVIEQVTQVTLLRVEIPWMIQEAFARVGDEEFMAFVAARLAGRPVTENVLADLDPVVRQILETLFAEKRFHQMLQDEFRGLAGLLGPQLPKFKALVQKAFHDPELAAAVGQRVTMGDLLKPAVQKEVGPTVKAGIRNMFAAYNFEQPTWSELVLSPELRQANDANRTAFQDTGGTGVLNRGALRYQLLVPSYTVMFAFFLVLSVGWLFVAERKHGTLVRLRAAPLARRQILLGKLLPCLAISLGQGVFLLVTGWLIFGMTWGTRPELLLPLVACTSCAAVGLAVLVASVARTETQVAVYGTLLVLVLGGVSGSLMPRDLMPEQMKVASLVTPHAWALDAYGQLLASPTPDVAAVLTSCVVLVGFGLLFTAVAWWRMDLD